MNIDAYVFWILPNYFMLEDWTLFYQFANLTAMLFIEVYTIENINDYSRKLLK